MVKSDLLPGEIIFLGERGVHCSHVIISNMKIDVEIFSPDFNFSLSILIFTNVKFENYVLF